MQKKMLLFGGIINMFFTFFHIFLGVQLYRLKGLPTDIHALLVMLNVGGTLFILYFAIAFLAYAKEVLTTKLGKLTILACFLLYASRALEEIVLAPDFSLFIFATCAITSLIFLFIYLPNPTKLVPSLSRKSTNSIDI